MKPLKQTLSLGLFAIVALGLSPMRNAEAENGTMQPGKSQSMRSASRTGQTSTNGSWITANGTVEQVTSDGFQMKYGDQTLMVKVGSWNNFQPSQQIKAGEKVTVSGRVDASSYRAKTIDADSVFAHERNTYFFSGGNSSSGQNFHQPYLYASRVTIPDGATVTMIGTVSDADDEEFVLRSGNNAITVETEDMEDNPLDDEGLQRIRNGDQVMVVGVMDDDLFEGKEIEADTVITLASRGGAARTNS